MNQATRVLLVDDEPNLRFLFQAALTSDACQVVTAADGEAALLWLASDRFDLVLLDLRMPGVGGLEVLESLRAIGDDTPVVMITAHGSVPDAVAAMKLGAIDFLTKPLAPAGLRAVVNDVLARRGAAGEEEPVTAAGQFATQLARAKQALNRRAFADAEVFLKQALALRDDSAEAHNLRGVLHELKRENDAAYHEYRAALKADRHYAPAQRNMQRYYERSSFGVSDIPVDLGMR